MNGTQSNAKIKIDSSEGESPDLRSLPPLNGDATTEFDGSGAVQQHFAVRDCPQRPNLLPSVEVAPNEGDDRKNDCRRTKDVASQIDSRLIPVSEQAHRDSVLPNRYRKQPPASAGRPEFHTRRGPPS